MRKFTLRVSVLAFLLPVFYVSACFSATAKVISIKGKAEIKAGAADWSPAVLYAELKGGDRIRTKQQSQVRLLMADGHKLTLFQNTSMTIDSADAGNNTFTLTLGRLRAFVKKLKRRNKFQAQTPIAVASIRGTEFELDVRGDKSTKISVFEGVVNFRDLAGLAEEVRVFKNQSVTLEPGKPPSAPQPISSEMKEGLIPESKSAKGGSALKAAIREEIGREVSLEMSKEQVQSAAALEMKTAQYQDGKTIIDAFGKRVRIEEYIARPSAERFSFVTLNTRDDRFDYSRFDVWANKALPEDLNSVTGELWEKVGDTPPEWYAVKQQWLASNTGDYYREWWDEGAPVHFTVSGVSVYRTIFQHMFVEIKGSGDPVLLTHMIPDTGLTNGTDYFATYIDYGTGSIGDSRPVDSESASDRLNYFDNTAVANAYKTSEGYKKIQIALYNDKWIYDYYEVAEELGYQQLITVGELYATYKFSALNLFDVDGDGSYNGSSDIFLKVDQYIINDEGQVLSLQNIADTYTDFNTAMDKLNFQNVMSSPSVFGGRKIDLVMSPRIFQTAGLQ